MPRIIEEALLDLINNKEEYRSVSDAWIAKGQFAVEDKSADDKESGGSE